MFNNLQKNTEEKFFRKYASYSLGQVAYSLASRFGSIFILYFYTDVVHIPLAITTIMFIIFKIIDPINDQFIALYMNKVTFSNGRYRRYYLILAIPLAISSVLLFFVPNASMPIKVIYAVITYLTWEFILSILSISTNAILPYLTPSHERRTKIISIKIFIATFIIFLIQNIAFPMINFLGSGNSQRGFFLTALIFSVISVPLNLIAYFNLKETNPVKNVNPSNFTSLRAIWRYVKKNKSLTILLLMHLFFNSACTLKDQLAPFFVSHVLNNMDLFGIFTSVSLIASLGMQFIIPVITKKINKEICMFVGVVGSIGSVIIMSSAINFIPLLLLGNFLYGIFSAIPANLIYIFIAEFVDNVQREDNLEISSIAFGSLGFFSKVGNGVATSSIPTVLALIGYNAEISVTSAVASNITYLFIFGPLILMVISIFFMVFHMCYINNKSSITFKNPF